MTDRKKYFAIILLILFFTISGFFVFPKIFKPKVISIAQPQSESSNIIDNANTEKPEAVPEENIIKEAEVADNSEKENTAPKENSEEKTVAVTKEKSSLSVANRLVAWGFEKASGRKIDTIIIHSSYDLLGNDPYSVSGLISEYKQYGVAPHYLIDRKGDTYKLVEEKDIAYHAGVSQVPDGRTNVNSFSIGIEMMNKEDGKFTDEQYDSLNKLLKDIKSRYDIKYTLGHNQIAPGRKTDPWGFEWDKVK